MCLIALAWHSHPDYPLVVVANRDEFYTRPTRPAAWWGQAVSVLAGRDEEAGGTWMGVTREGRFAALTNVRAPGEKRAGAASRGELVVAALQARQDAHTWLHEAAARPDAYNGYNLLVADLWPAEAGSAQLLHHSNRSGAAPQPLAPGVYGLSNAQLDTPWPKLTRAVGRVAVQVASRVDAEALMGIFADRRAAPSADLPSTGVAPDWEKALSAIQIRANGYGTRSTTVITVRADGLVNFVERSFDVAAPAQHTDRHYEFSLARRVPAGDR